MPSQSSPEPKDPNPIQARVALCLADEDPNCIARMTSGFTVLTDRQPEAIHGCCMLVPWFADGAINGERDPAAGTLNDLTAKARGMFLSDLATLGDAVLAATGAEHVNYLILCNQVAALHGHVVPRYASEEPAKRLADPFAAYDFPGSREPDALNNERDAALIERLRELLTRSIASP